MKSHSKNSGHVTALHSQELCHTCSTWWVFLGVFTHASATHVLHCISTHVLHVCENVYYRCSTHYTCIWITYMCNTPKNRYVLHMYHTCNTCCTFLHTKKLYSRLCFFYIKIQMQPWKSTSKSDCMIFRDVYLLFCYDMIQYRYWQNDTDTIWYQTIKKSTFFLWAFWYTQHTV